MLQSDGGFIAGWAGKIRGIVTKVQVAVLTKSDPYDYRPELEKAISDLAGQAAGWVHGPKATLIQSLMGRLKTEAEILETPNTLTPEAHQQPHTIKRAAVLREVVEMLKAHLPARLLSDEVAAPLLPHSENRSNYRSDTRQEKLF